MTEDDLEQGLLSTLEGMGYEKVFGPDIAPGEPGSERETFLDVVLVGRLREAMERLNPGIPAEALDEAVKEVLRQQSPSMVENNRRFHRMLTDGVQVEYRTASGEIRGDAVWLIDKHDPDKNEWLAVNQFTVIEDKRNRRPDVVIFVNGLPLVVIELKNPADEKATVKKAYNQLQTYKKEIPALMRYNEALIISDGLEAKMGTLTADWERFTPWRMIDGSSVVPLSTPQLDVLTKGVLARERLLDLILHYVVYEDDGEKVVKKMAAYHQYHAVTKAVERTVQATSPEGDRRIGVVWHTQGSGKSLSMVFYGGKVIAHPAMENPTLVVITDRNDLDDQLHGTFSRCADVLRQEPDQAESRDELRQLLSVAAGGVIFTTIHKFFPENQGESYPMLSDRRNIVVIADEAHRSQYDFIDGFARHMRDALPNASFIGFTGTPIETTDKNTQAVFGDYIDIYDIQRAVEDGATVRIYYEGRLAKIDINEDERPKIDPEFAEITEGQEETDRQKLRSKWSRLEAMVGTEKRIGLVAEDLVKHWEDRLSAMDGKAMIVCMSRRICVELYAALVKLRPNWHHDDDDKGAIKVVMTGSASDPLDWQQHIRSKMRREDMAKRFKNPTDPLKLVIVRDMWLTGFDAPCLHTMYADKPMRSHGLMQAIARVNRVFKDKPGGLVVDYLGLADQLKRALADYTASGGKGEGTHDQNEAVAIMLEKYEIVCSMLHKFDYNAIIEGPKENRMAGIASAMEFVLGLEDGKKRFVQVVTELTKAFALSVPHEEAIGIRDEVGFFQAVKAGLAKYTEDGGEKERTEEEIETALRQIVSKAVVSEEVVDIFSAAGLKKPDISILSDEFLEEVRSLPHRNLALELLKKLLNGEIKARAMKNVVEARSFAEMLEEAVKKYQNRSIETAEVISELVNLAREMREAHHRGDKLGLSEDELAFYDALEVNDSAVKVMGDDALRMIAQELVQSVRNNVTIDWSVRESARAHLRRLVKRILRKYGYPPDKQEKATLTVLEQAEVLCKDWTRECA